MNHMRTSVLLIGILFLAQLYLTGCNNHELVKVSGAYSSIDPTPFVSLDDWYLSIGITNTNACVYSRETNEHLGYAMALSNVSSVDISRPESLLEIKLLADNESLYILQPADHKVYTWIRSAT